MNEAGNHGGSDPGETEATLLFASPKFKVMPRRRKNKCPTSAKEGTRFHFYNTVEQQDVVPTLSGLMGLPMPRNSIGRVLSEFRGVWQDDETYVNLLEQNAQQIWNLVDTALGREGLHSGDETRHTAPREEHTTARSYTDSTDTAGRLACFLAIAEQETERSRETQHWDRARVAYEEFLERAQQALISGNRPFNVLHMGAGIATCALALLMCLHSIGASWPSRTTGITFASIAAYYGIMLFGSASERSEQSFWYLSSFIWVVCLDARAKSHSQDELVRSRITRSCVRILAFHCIAVCWTCLGPFIDYALFSQHITLKWSVMAVAYSWNLTNIARHTFGRLMTRTAAVLLTMPLVTAAFAFKISHEQQHPHEITLPFVVDKVSLFRTAVVLIVLATLMVCILVARRDSLTDKHLAARHSTLPERLHHLLTLFLITQSRAENIPLFFILKHQQMALRTLLQQATPAYPNSILRRRITNRDASAVDVAISVLVFSNTYFFCFGGSNSISSIDLSNAYNGISDYNIVTVGVLLFSGNWTGPTWWCSTACDLVPRDLPRPLQQVKSGKRHRSADEAQRHFRIGKLYDELTNDRPGVPWLTYLSTMSAFMASGVLIVMVLCTVKREESTVWTIWGPKYLYSVFWVLEWHLVVSLGLSSVLRALGKLG
jgi:ethanolaminephosphotransferase